MSVRSRPGTMYYPMLRTIHRPPSTPTTTDLSVKYNYTNSNTYGENVWGWRNRIARGEDVTTDADGVKISHTYQTGNLDVRWTQFSSQVYQDKYYGPIGTNIDPGVDYSYSSDLYNQALTRFVSRAREVQHRFQAGTALGEIRQTINLLKSPFRGVRRLTQSYRQQARSLPRNANGNLGARARRELSNRYLQYQFGIRPLLQDIDDAVYDLANLSVGKSLLIPVKVSVRERRQPVQPVSQQTATPLSFWTVKKWTSTNIEESVVIRGAVRCLLPSFDFEGSNALSVAMSDFVPTLYELIPYSFLVDYFTNIGDIVSALSFLDSSVSWCNSTRRMQINQRQDMAWTFAFPTSPSYVLYSTSGNQRSSARTTRIKYQRRKVSSYVPSFRFSIPGSGDMRWLNIAALFGQSRRI